jgi:hypothetical protein
MLVQRLERAVVHGKLMAGRKMADCGNRIRHLEDHLQTT